MNPARGEWFRMELWSLREAAYLLCGREPAAERDFPAERDSGSDIAQTYRELKDATHTGALMFIRADAQDTLMRRRVIPIQAIAWGRARAAKLGLPFSALLDEARSVKPETPSERATRRLDHFRKLGGVMKPAGGGWHCVGRRGALAVLVREEQAARHPRSDRSDIRRDLIAAMEAHSGS